MKLKVGLDKIVLYITISLLILSGCSGISKPFGKGDDALIPALTNQAPEISITSIKGITPTLKPTLVERIKDEGARRNISIVDKQNNSNNYSFSGHISVKTVDSGTMLIYVWDLIDKNGKKERRIKGEETIPSISKDPWSIIDDAVLWRVAYQTVEELSSHISRKGYDTRSASLLPPADLYAKRPDDNEEGIENPRYANPLNTAPIHTASINNIEQSKNSNNKKEQKNTKKITAIFIPKVTGSPGLGNKELTTAMCNSLKNTGLKITGKKTKGYAITIKGNVKFGKKEKGKQPVSLAWEVIDPNGEKIGTIRQNNNVPAGILDKTWGGSAQLATNAASDGIIKLIKKQLR